MESLIQQIAGYGEQFIHVIWFPLLIWTLLSGLIWIALRTVSNVHPQYQYHTRLALLFALPGGFLILGAIQLSGILFLQSPSESLALISVTAPFEMSVTPSNTSWISAIEIVYAAVFVFFSTGVILMAIRNLMQWFQLNQLKSRCTFISIGDTEELDPSNIELIQQTDKRIRAAFLDEEIIPVTFGVRKPVILIPKSLKSDSEKLNLVLRHELTHIKQNDFLSNMIISLTQIVFWFHPFVHVLKREVIDYREIRCDSLVLSNSSVSKKKYASLLLELLPLPNINKELSVNMAQESSNLKKRIQMITQQQLNRPIPKRSSVAIFAFVILSTALAMSCTDMQSSKIFDEEELNLMTDVDQTGERGYHQIKFFPADESVFERRKEQLDNLNQLSPEHIHSIEVFKGQNAIDKFGVQASEGAIVINTNLNADSYNTVLEALGMERQEISPNQSPDKQNHFTVVEQMPELIGGLEDLQRKIQYPEEALQAEIEGRVYVQFIVNEEGNVEDARVIRGIGGGADEEALRVVRQAKFKPGYQRGEPVRVQYSLPIFFQLSAANGQDQSSINRSGLNSSEIENPEVIYNKMEISIDRVGNTIEGNVVDSESGEPLVGANINIIKADENTGTSTNESGQFKIEENGSEISQLMVSYIGYRPVEVNL